jgi:2,5-diketo-D-gluconate reductase B
MLDYLRSNAIPLTAYTPLAQGRAANDPTLAAIGIRIAAPALSAWLEAFYRNEILVRTL